VNNPIFLSLLHGDAQCRDNIIIISSMRPACRALSNPRSFFFFFFRRGKKRVTRMIVAVVLAFAICWLPIHIILVLKSIDVYHQTTTLVAFQIISHVLAYTNSCINPILYCFLSENFRKAFRKVGRVLQFN
jgi:hypothetical protein